MAEALGMGVLPRSSLRGGQLSGKYLRNGGAPADSMRPARGDGPTEQGWVVIDAVARVAAEIGVGSAEVARLEITLTPEQLAALDEPSTPSLHFPAGITARLEPVMGFGAATVDGVELPVWPMLLTNSARH
jgi:hypothetical protein